MKQKQKQKHEQANVHPLHTPAKQARIVDLMAEYYELRDKIDALEEQARHKRAELLRICKVGDYGVARVIDFHEVEINVSSYVRHGYRAIVRKQRKQES